MSYTKDLSIVIPLLNESESLPELTAWIDRTVKVMGVQTEIIFIDDGSTDNSWKVIQDLKKTYEYIRAFKFTRNYGKSAGLFVGFREAKGKVVFTMDADLQDSPDEIPEMYNMIVEEGYHLVSGWKKKRYDPLSKTIPTKLYNGVLRKLSGIKLNDFNCGLKAYKSEVIKNIEVYGEMHRYIPAMAKWAGYEKIGEKVVQHQARKYGVSKFGMERFIRGPLDMLSILFVGKFGKRPMHLFGGLGTLVFLVGFVLFAVIGGTKVYYILNSLPYKNIADMSGFFIALTAMVIGTQLFLAGFLAELISRNSPSRNKYIVEEEIG